MVVSDRGFEEVVSAHLSRILIDLHCNLRSAQALLVWVSCKISLADEVSLEIT